MRCYWRNIWETSATDAANTMTDRLFSKVPEAALGSVLGEAEALLEADWVAEALEEEGSVLETADDVLRKVHWFSICKEWTSHLATYTLAPGCEQ